MAGHQGQAALEDQGRKRAVYVWCPVIMIMGPGGGHPQDGHHHWSVWHLLPQEPGRGGWAMGAGCRHSRWGVCSQIGSGRWSWWRSLVGRQRARQIGRGWMITLQAGLSLLQPGLQPYREHLFKLDSGVRDRWRSMDLGLDFGGWQSGGHGTASGTGRGSFRRLQMPSKERPVDGADRARRVGRRELLLLEGHHRCQIRLIKTPIPPTFPAVTMSILRYPPLGVFLWFF
jgi:hypothetical protein